MPVQHAAQRRTAATQRPAPPRRAVSDATGIRGWNAVRAWVRGRGTTAEGAMVRLTRQLSAPPASAHPAGIDRQPVGSWRMMKHILTHWPHDAEAVGHALSVPVTPHPDTSTRSREAGLARIRHAIRIHISDPTLAARGVEALVAATAGAADHGVTDAAFAANVATTLDALDAHAQDIGVLNRGLDAVCALLTASGATRALAPAVVDRLYEASEQSPRWRLLDPIHDAARMQRVLRLGEIAAGVAGTGTASGPAIEWLIAHGEIGRATAQLRAQPDLGDREGAARVFSDVLLAAASRDHDPTPLIDHEALELADAQVDRDGPATAVWQLLRGRLIEGDATTSVHRAVLRSDGDLNPLQTLLDRHGADAASRTNDAGMSAIAFAAAHHRGRAVELFAARGATLPASARGRYGDRYASGRTRWRRVGLERARLIADASGLDLDTSGLVRDFAGGTPTVAASEIP